MTLLKSQISQGTILTKLQTCFDPELAEELEVINMEGDELLLKVSETGETFTSTVEILSAFYQTETPLSKEDFPDAVSRDISKALDLLRSYTSEIAHGGFSPSGMTLTTLLYSLKEKADKLSNRDSSISTTVSKLAKR